MKQVFSIKFIMPNRMDLAVIRDWINEKLYDKLDGSQYAGMRTDGIFGSTSYGSPITGKIEIELREPISSQKVRCLLGTPPEGITELEIKQLV